jgi:AsmA protein
MRWIVRGLGVAVSLVILAVAGVFLLPAERIANLAAAQFQATTGRALTVGGRVRPTIWPIVGARIENVALASADWAQGGAILRADVLDIGVDLAGLWGGNLTVRRFEMSGAQIVLERDAQGRANWVFEGVTGGGSGAGTGAGTGGAATPAGQPARPADPGGTLSLEQVQIRNATVLFIDRASGTEMRVEGLDADLTMPDFAGPGTLAVSGRQGGQAFRADLRIAAVEGFLAGRVTSVTLAATVGDARVGFEGRVGMDPLALDGRATVQAPALAPLMAFAGRPGPEPLPPAARPLDFAGQVTLAPAGSLHLREARLTAGATRTDMALDITFDGQRPRVAGTVSAGALDLRPYLGGGGAQAAAPAQDATGWPRTALDASALGALDAAVTLSAGPVQTGTIDLERVQAVLTIDRARAVLDLREARLHGGTLAGELVANNRSGLSVGGNIRAAGINLLPLLRQAAGYERLNGTGGFQLQFLGSGQSVDAIMRSLSGQGRIDLGQGEIIGLDLAGMLRNMDMSYMGDQNRTVFDALTGSFAIASGVLINQDLRMTSPRLSVEGRGRVDLGAQVLDYRVTPIALTNTESGATIRVPLVITGPWSAPRFRLDLEGLAEQRLREERERIEARAREELARREGEVRARAEAELQQRLGIQRQEGQSTREAVEQGVRDRAEQELGRSLQRLLGGGSN